MSARRPLLALAAAVLAAALGSGPPAAGPAAPSHRIVAYYFHTNFRCATCRKLETYSREAVEKGFARELRAGALVWRTVNIEEKGNEHFVQDYALYTKSLVLVEESGGRQVRWKNCPRIWQLVGDKDRFLQYVRAEVRSYLKERT